MIQLRDYQRDAVAAVYSHLRTRDDNPCVVIPTAGGKTPVMATVCRDAVQQWDGRALILAHVRELLEQTTDSLHALAPDLWSKIGVYSAGLKSRDTEHPIIVAGIQSVYKRAAELGRFDIILIDEAHMIPPDGEGMYQTFLADAKVVNPNVKLIGLTATPYRMTTGMICAADHLLNHVCYEVGVRELIVQGYLCPLKSKAGKQKADTSNLHLRGGEFIPAETEALMNSGSVVYAACREIVEMTSDRQSTLIFASGIEHAKNIQQIFATVGHECGMVDAGTLPFDRAEVLRRFREGGLKYLVNVNVLTTGFDAPNIDCIALLRPTNSPGLYYQMVGRGFRICPGKTNCLILDFGENIVRHGPVDDLRIEEPGTGTGEAPAKECPQCQAVIHAGYLICPECGYEFPPPDRRKHGKEASREGILSGEVTDTEYEVSGASYYVHEKRNAPPDHPRTMRVTYRVTDDLCKTIDEWVCLEHGGYAGNKAWAWWRERSLDQVPKTAEEACDLAAGGALAKTLAITVRSVAGEKYDRIIAYKLGPRPALQAEGESDMGEGETFEVYGDVLPATDEELPF